MGLVCLFKRRAFRMSEDFDTAAELHVVPLKRGGADLSSNMQWQTKAVF